MTVAELIECLTELPPEMTVVVLDRPGYHSYSHDLKPYINRGVVVI